MNKDWKEFIESLQSQNVEFLIVGAFALAQYGLPRFTQDLDIFLDRSPDSARNLRAAFSKFGLEMSESAEQELISNPRAMIVLGNPPSEIDLLNFLDGVEFKDAWNHRIRGTIVGIEADFISKEDFILSKLATGRPKDLQDVQRLQEILGS